MILMKTLTLALLAAASVAASASTAQTPATLHVTAVRDWAATDPPPSSHGSRVYVIVGTIGGVRYTTEQLFSWGSQHFQVGADYAVTMKGQSLNVKMEDKKGREVPERLNVVATEEVPK
jgi:hypothetical protein